jgi:AraC-like DNA-binding protein
VDTPTIELIRAAMTSSLPDGHFTRQTMHDTLELRIKQYLEQHLGEADLDAARIAAAHHISVRHLYTMLARMGISLGEWLRLRRLEKSRLDLAGREGPSTTIAAIARRWGFADPTHFSRVFRAAYGMSPREWRASQAGQHLAR